VFARAISLIERYSARFVATAIAFVVIAGLLYSSWLGPETRFPDEDANITLATHLASTFVYSFDGAHPTAFVPPGYPFFLTPLRFLGADVVALRVLNFLVLGTCMYLVYRFLKRHSTRLAATLGVLLILGYPVLLYTAGTLYSQTLASCLLLGIMLLYAHPENSSHAMVLRGLLLGWLVLTVPICLVVLLMVTIWRWMAFPHHCRPQVVISLAIAVLVVAVWSTRNYLTFGAFILVSTNSGFNLLLGNSEHTTPMAGVNVPIDEHLQRAASLDEVEKDRFFRARALEFIQNNKLHTFRLYCLKFLNHFNYRNQLYSAGEQRRARDVIMLVTYMLLLILLVIRTACFRVFPPAPWEWLFLCTYIAGGLAYAVFFTRIRFRLPFDCLLICLVAHFIGCVLSARRRVSTVGAADSCGGT